MTARLATTNNRLAAASKTASGAADGKKVRATHPHPHPHTHPHTHTHALPAAHQAIHQPSRAAEGRRANKPLMEKRRRARINQSLAVLKTLILDSARLENTKHSKLEKADILELTVRHLQRQRTLGSAVLSKYRAGFQECAREVSRFLDSTDVVCGGPPPTLDPAVKQRLVRHLESCVSELDLDFHLAAEKRGAAGGCEGPVRAEADSEGRPDSSTAPAPAPAPAPADDNNNNSDSHLDRNHEPAVPPVKAEGGGPLECALLGRPGAGALGGPDVLPQSCLVAATVSPGPMDGIDGVRSPTNPMLSVVQVIPSRLPDGQVIFLLPSHYVQLAAAAAASSLSQCVMPSTSSSPTASILAWLPKTPDQPDIASTFQIKEEFESEDTMPLDEQPIDFTVTKHKSEMDTLRSGSCSEGGEEGRLFEGQEQSVEGVKDDESVWRPW